MVSFTYTSFALLAAAIAFREWQPVALEPRSRVLSAMLARFLRSEERQKSGSVVSSINPLGSQDSSLTSLR